jgi:hypothetical protein
MHSRKRPKRGQTAGSAPTEAGIGPDGVDVTLIRWMLSMTPAQRLRTLQRNVRSLLRLRSENSGS